MAKKHKRLGARFDQGNTPHKSEEGWRRFRERTGYGLRAFRHGLHVAESKRTFTPRESVIAKVAAWERQEERDEA